MDRLELFDKAEGIFDFSFWIIRATEHEREFRDYSVFAAAPRHLQGVLHLGALFHAFES